MRPADRSHPYGHGKAEHLAALAEASILVLISLLLAAVRRLVDGTSDVDATWYALVVIVVVIVIDASRAAVLHRSSRAYQSPAFAASALHFAGDLAGSTVVLLGLLAARAGYPEGDAIAALFVAVLVLVAAGRLIRRNVDVLMDQAPVDEDEAARRAIQALGPGVTLRRLLRRAAVGTSRTSSSASRRGRPSAKGTAADAVEQAVERAVPGRRRGRPRRARRAGELGERATAARYGCPACARCTTSPCSRSTTAWRSRST